MTQTNAALCTPDEAEPCAPPAKRPTPPPPVLALASDDDFVRLLERHQLRCQRAHEPLTALRLQVLPLGSPATGALGAALLDECARRLCGRVRAMDTVARWQATQFGVLLPRCPTPHAPAVLNRLARAVEEPYSVEGHTLHLRLLGVLLAPAAR